MIQNQAVPSDDKEVIDAGLKLEEHAGIVETIGICLREITADLLAARMAGVRYRLAFNEFFKTLVPWRGPIVKSPKWLPGFWLRLKLIFEELRSESAGIEAVSALKTIIVSWRLQGKDVLKDYVARLETRVESAPMPTPASTPRTREGIIEKTVISAVPAIQELVRGIISCWQCSSDQWRDRGHGGSA